MKNLSFFAFCFFYLLGIFNCSAQIEKRDVLYGNKGYTDAPIMNYFINTYQGSEILYLKNELGLDKGDVIKALSFKTQPASFWIDGKPRFSGGVFVVSIKNTTLNHLWEGSEDFTDPTVLKTTPKGADVFNVLAIEAYEAGDQITLNLEKPFVYEGNNIIIDIRNCDLFESVSDLFFSGVESDPRLVLRWRYANHFLVDGFIPHKNAQGDSEYGIFFNRQNEKVFRPQLSITYITAKRQQAPKIQNRNTGNGLITY